MFADLADYPNIVVTGPQRSGTRICTHMIAYDTGYKSVEEKAIEYDEYPRLELILQEPGHVVQCPCLCHMAHQMPDEVLVVFMQRPVDEIIASQKRINWDWEQREKDSYGLAKTPLFGDDDPRTGELNGKEPIALIKQVMWKRQKQDIKHWLEIEYHSLKSHPLWISDRKDFLWNQTRSQKNEDGSQTSNG